MNKDPHVARYLDEDERELVEAEETGNYEPGESLLTPELQVAIKAAGRNTLNETSEKISSRISQSDLARVKARALR